MEFQLSRPHSEEGGSRPIKGSFVVVLGDLVYKS